jgi:protein tyrosine/serine phosphatase
MARVIRTEGVDNLRDFGGYPTACGRGLKTGQLFRSAHHQNATDEDLKTLEDLRLAVIVDLRRAEERARYPSRRPGTFQGQVIQNDIGDTDSGWEAMLRGQDPTEAFFRAKSLEWYRRAAFEPRHVDLFARYFAALAEADGPVLIHCAAGKDRTGLLAALTHHLAGVRREDMIEDYLLTNTLDFHQRRAESIAGLITVYTGVVPSDAAVRAAMGVEAPDLEAAFEAIEAQYGSVDAYLDRALGVDAGKRRVFEARFMG